MRIKKIRIFNYGPIREFSITPGNFDVIFGLNEAGKTAIVEVLTYLLFRRTSANLRYDKPSEVLIEIEDNGQVWSLPAKKSMIELPAGDVANLMYVEASKTGVFGPRGEGSFWDGVKSLLSRVGSGVSFTRLDENIFLAVGLQPRKEEWRKEKQIEVEGLIQRREELSNYLQAIGSIGKKETELTKLEAERDALSAKITVIEKFRAFRDFQELMKLYQTHEETAKSLQAYERYKYEYLDEWQKLESEKEARSEATTNLRAVERDMDTLRREYGALEEIEKRVEAEGLRPYLTQVGEERVSPSMFIPLAVVNIALIAAVVSYFLGISLIPSVIFLGIALVLLGYFVRRRIAAKRILADREQHLNKAKTIFPDVKSFADVRAQVDGMQQQKIVMQTSIREKEKLIRQMTSTRSLEDISKEMGEIRAKAGLAEITDLRRKLSEKRQLEENLSRINASLTERLHESDQMKWERMIRERKAERPDIEPDLDAEKDLRDRRNETQRKIDDLTREITVFRDVQQAKSGVVDDRAGFMEFQSLSRRLNDYELEKEAALAARDILREMSSELDDFIGQILDGEDGLCGYFKSVTNRYPGVVIEKKNFVVLDEKGNKYPIENLSSGAQDQLLFCFRLAAVRKVYPKGAFMILDDAFIFADWERRQKLAGLAKDFIKQGNQILYFTSDDHTRDMLATYGAKITSL